jgi:hypothetical protein
VGFTKRYRDFGRTDHRQVSAQTANRRRIRTLRQSLNLLLLRASVVGRDTMKRPPIEETSHDRLAPQSRVRRRPDDSRIAFCRCAGMPKSAPHCDRRRRHGPARVRSGRRANARLPSRFAAPDIWTSYARNNGVNEQLGDPLISRGSHDCISPARRDRIRSALLGMVSLPLARRTTLHKRTHHCDVGGEHE